MKARMYEKPQTTQAVVPGVTTVIVHASVILAWVSLALAGLAILASVCLKLDAGRIWERICWLGAVASALLAYQLQLRRRGRVVFSWSADSFGGKALAAMAAKIETPLRLQYTTRTLFAFVTASALLIGFVALPPDFKELVVVLALLAPVVTCTVYLACATHIGPRHLVVFVIALVPLIAVVMLFGPLRSWLWR
jgi:hypothetical protein